MRLLPMLVLGLVVSPLAAQAPPADRPALMPWPATVTWGDGRLALDSTVRFTTPAFHDARLDRAIARAQGRLAGRIGRRLGAGETGMELAVRVTGPGEAVQSPAEDESYRLMVSPTSATLSAPTVVGAIRGLETLLQLVSTDSAGFFLPATTIADQPRFPWRGLLLDVARHWMPPDVVRRTLDGMAAVKLNVFHWHLSEDQGFRVESRRYPKLQHFGSDGLYYTQDQLREIIAYARDRGIRVVPEFDMPGHSTSWFVGYPAYASAPGPYAIERQFGVFDPAFDPSREETYRFIEGFVAEMTGLFPDQYWHVGGDEVSGRHWDQSPRLTRFKRQKGFRDNEALQTYFNQRLSAILTRHRRRMVGWDEILHPGLPASTVVQSWRGTEYLGQASKAGYSGILSAPYYLDHIDPADQHYLADPIPPAAGLTPEQAAGVLGGEACMWAEHIGPETVDSRIWPRMAAIAERFWSPASVRDVDDMYRRLSVVSLRLEELGLGQEGHYAKLLRRIVGGREVEPARKLLEITMPVTFGERSNLQRTTQLTPLTGLVDAARPDPWIRSRLIRLARGAADDPASRDRLETEFHSWEGLSERIAALGRSAPVLNDGLPAARAAEQLARLALDALDRIGTGRSADSGWVAAARAQLTELQKPQGLLRLAGVEGVGALVEIAARREK
jgi:hexosaminidase